MTKSNANKLEDHNLSVAFMAACICQKGTVLNLTWQEITFAIRYALSVFYQGHSGASAIEAGNNVIREIAAFNRSLKKAPRRSSWQRLISQASDS